MMFGKNPGTDETWKRIPEGSIGAELGVWQGNSSKKFLKRARHVHLVDSWSLLVYEESMSMATMKHILIDIPN